MAAPTPLSIRMEGRLERILALGPRYRRVTARLVRAGPAELDDLFAEVEALIALDALLEEDLDVFARASANASAAEQVAVQQVLTRRDALRTTILGFFPEGIAPTPFVDAWSRAQPLIRERASLLRARGSFQRRRFTVFGLSSAALAAEAAAVAFWLRFPAPPLLELAGFAAIGTAVVLALNLLRAWQCPECGREALRLTTTGRTAVRTSFAGCPQCGRTTADYDYALDRLGDDLLDAVGPREPHFDRNAV